VTAACRICGQLLYGLAQGEQLRQAREFHALAVQAAAHLAAAHPEAQSLFRPPFAMLADLLNSLFLVPVRAEDDGGLGAARRELRERLAELVRTAEATAPKAAVVESGETAGALREK
jgi:hypothetical protein